MAITPEAGRSQRQEFHLGLSHEWKQAFAAAFPGELAGS